MRSVVGERAGVSIAMWLRWRCGVLLLLDFGAWLRLVGSGGLGLSPWLVDMWSRLVLSEW
jgi:hypothetical protein